MNAVSQHTKPSFSTLLDECEATCREDDLLIMKARSSLKEAYTSNHGQFLCKVIDNKVEKMESAIFVSKIDLRTSKISTIKNNNIFKKTRCDDEKIEVGFEQITGATDNLIKQRFENISKLTSKYDNLCYQKKQREDKLHTLKVELARIKKNQQDCLKITYLHQVKVQKLSKDTNDMNLKFCSASHINSNYKKVKETLSFDKQIFPKVIRLLEKECQRLEKVIKDELLGHLNECRQPLKEFENYKKYLENVIFENKKRQQESLMIGHKKRKSIANELERIIGVKRNAFNQHEFDDSESHIQYESNSLEKPTELDCLQTKVYAPLDRSRQSIFFDLKKLLDDLRSTVNAESIEEITKMINIQNKREIYFTDLYRSIIKKRKSMKTIAESLKMKYINDLDYQEMFKNKMNDKIDKILGKKDQTTTKIKNLNDELRDNYYKVNLVMASISQLCSSFAAWSKVQKSYCLLYGYNTKMEGFLNFSMFNTVSTEMDWLSSISYLKAFGEYLNEMMKKIHENIKLRNGRTPTESNENKTDNFETIKILSSNSDWVKNILVELNSKTYSDFCNIDTINRVFEETEDYETHTNAQLDDSFYLTSEEIKRRSIELTKEMKQKILKEKPRMVAEKNQRTLRLN